MVIIIYNSTKNHNSQESVVRLRVKIQLQETSTITNTNTFPIMIAILRD